MYAKQAFIALAALILCVVPNVSAQDAHRPFHVPSGYVPSSVPKYALPEPAPAVPAALETVSEAIDLVLSHEGGYSHHGHDPGGPTRYGITQRTARAHGYVGSMQRLPLVDARRIYAAIWDAYALGTLQDKEVAIQAFDAIVAHGPRAKYWIREGPDACRYINQRRMAAYRNSANWAKFHRGWTIRINKNLARCPE
jgi:lysozyme family protein